MWYDGGGGVVETNVCVLPCGQIWCDVHMYIGVFGCGANLMLAASPGYVDAQESKQSRMRPGVKGRVCCSFGWSAKSEVKVQRKWDDCWKVV